MTFKICLVIPSMHSGGMERVMSELANNFANRTDVEVSLVMYGLSPSVFFQLSDKIKVYSPEWEFNVKRRLWHTIRRMLFLRKIVKNIHPDTILSFGEYWNSFVLLGLFGLNIPVYVSDRCQPDKSLGRVHNLLRRIIYPTAAGVIAQTEKAKRIYDNLSLNKRIEVIGNPIRTIYNEPTTKRESIVLSVGRLIASKHHDLLIDIFVKCNMPGWKLIIVGGDAIKQNGMAQLQAKIKELKVEDSINLAGNQSDVDKYYQKSAIFAFTSSSEGFPNVVGEAMSSGIPVVAFDCVAGPSDLIVHGESGFLIPLFDIIEFQTHLGLLMKNSELRENMGYNAKKAINEFSVDAISDKYYCFIGRN